MASLFKKVISQLNPFDGGATFKNPTPQGNQQPAIQAIQNAKYGVLANNSQAQQKLIQQTRPPQVDIGAVIRALQNTPATMATKAVGRGVQYAGQHLPELPKSTPIGRGVNSLVINPIKKTDQRVGQVLQGKNPYKGTKEQQAGQILEDLANMASVIPVGKAANVAGKSASAGAKITQGAKIGAKAGAVFGGAQGASGAMQQNGDVRTVVNSGLMGTAIGGAAGGALGGAIPAGFEAGKIVKSSFSVPKRPAPLTDLEVARIGQYRDIVGTGAIVPDNIAFSAENALTKAGIHPHDVGAVDNLLGAFRNYQTQLQKSLVPNEIGAVGKNVNASSSKSPKLPLDPKTGKQSQLGELQPQSLGLQKTQKGSTPTILPDNSLTNNTINSGNSKVKLNTKRMELTKKQQKQLEKETSDVIATMSNKDIQHYAKTAGIDPKTHTPEQTKKIIAEQLNVRRDAVKLQREAEIARKSGDIETTKQLLLASAERGRISRTQGTDIARQLQARRIIANELDTPQQRIFKLLDEAGVNPEEYTKILAEVDFNNPKQVVDAYRKLVPPTALEWLDTVRYNSMLSSPLTHAINAVSNALNIGVVAPVEKTLRGTIDSMGGLFGHERKYAAGEGGAYVSGAVRNIQQAADNFVDAMRGTPQNFNLDLLEFNTPLATKGLEGATYNTLSFPMRILGASDKFFRTLASGGEEAALALRQRKGIKIKGSVKELGQAEADYRLFQQDTNVPDQGAILDSIDSVTESIMKLRKDHVWARFIFPFVKTPTNILKQGIEFSPLGGVNALSSGDKVTSITRASIGTAVFGAAWSMVGSGDTTWGEPTNKEQRDRFRAEGKQPYAMRIGGHWFGFSKLPPAVSFPFAMTAALNDAMQNSKISSDKVDQIMTAIAKYGEFLGDQSYVKNIGDTLGAFKGDSEKAVQAVSNYPQQIIPFRALTGWVARMSDSQERQVNTDKGFVDKQVQSLMMNYPGLRQKLETRNYRGEPIPANNPVLNGISPFRITDDRGTNPLDQASDAYKKSKEKDPDIPKNQTKQYDKYIDKQVNDAQKELLNSSEYKALSDEDKGKALNTLKTKITSAYKRRYMTDHNIPVNEKASSSDLAILNGSKDYNSLSKSKKAGSTDSYDKSPDSEYKTALDKYNEDKKAGTITSVENIKRTKELNRLKVGSTYDKNVRDAFSLSKADLDNYLKTPEDGVDKNKLVEQILAYDDALTKAGIQAKNKFRDKFGNIAITPKPKGSGVKGKKSKGKKAPKIAVAKVRLPKSVRIGKAPKGKIASVAKPKYVKLSAKKGKKIKV